MRHRLPTLSGIELEVHDRADDCVSLVSRRRPRYVLMDFHMRSSLKGDEAVQRLRAHFGPELPILGISSAPSLNQKLLLAGANRTVQKNHFGALLEELVVELTREQEKP